MKILVVLPRFPFPLEKGDKLRAYHQIRTLAERNEIYLFAISHQPVNEEQMVEMRRYCIKICVVNPPRMVVASRAALNLFRVRSLQVGYWYSHRLHRRYRKFEALVQPDIIYSQMIRTMSYVADSKVPKVMDFQDALSMNVERRMMSMRNVVNKAGTIHSGRSPRYMLLHFEYKMLRSMEYKAFDIFDALTVIAETDSEAIPHHFHHNIDIVRNGVDFDYFFPREAPKQHSIVFCGNMQYKPNIDAARYLVNDIMPLVWRELPDADVVLAGATPKAAVRQLAGNRVTVTGTVDDIRDCYASAQVMVAPMRIGSGLQNKLLEAMAMRVPCVTTPLANESLGATPDVEVCVGKNAEELAACIVRLLSNEQLRNAMADRADAFVHDNFSWEASSHQLESIFQQVLDKKKMNTL